jgi:hypothetical protein
MKRPDFFRLRSLIVGKPFEERFHESYIPEPNSGCWLWIGTDRGQFGYGNIIRNGTHLGAHRASWELHYGPIPDGMFVCHRCDVRACVNPKHLFLGSIQENNLDSRAKGRNVKGAKHGCAKLTEEQARAIKASVRSLTELAAQFGISRASASAVRTGRTWRHL